MPQEEVLPPPYFSSIACHPRISLVLSSKLVLTPANICAAHNIRWNKALSHSLVQGAHVQLAIRHGP